VDVAVEDEVDARRAGERLPRGKERIGLAEVRLAGGGR
jgi:hypothetical protein